MKNQAAGALRIDDLASIPAEFSARLSHLHPVFASNPFVENLLSTPELARLAAELDGHLQNNWIRGYHCTREPSEGYFHAQGLRVTDVAQHQAEFVAKFGYRFTSAELAEMAAAWHSYFVKERQAELRNGQIWACLTRNLILEDRGVDLFFALYGGEAISMPFDDHPTITSKLASIGSPVVVEVAVPGNALRAGYPMSTALLSRYHQTVRQDAHIFESEAMWRAPVAPEHVLSVTPLDLFPAQGLNTTAG